MSALVLQLWVMPAVFAALASRLSSIRIPRAHSLPWQAFWPCLLALVPLLAWDFSGADLPIARMLATSQGFPWQHHWLPAHLLYVVPRAVDSVLLVVLALCIAYPSLSLGLLTRQEAVWWLATTVTCLLVVLMIKKISATSCPWSLAEFGGDKSATYLSHWVFGQTDGGPGGCFPSGHASTAFAFLAGYYVLKRASSNAARLWLIGVVLAGLTVGISQTVRGAHYVSHALWTAWICWVLSSLALVALHPWPMPGRASSAAETVSGLREVER